MMELLCYREYAVMFNISNLFPAEKYPLIKNIKFYYFKIYDKISLLYILL